MYRGCSKHALAQASYSPVSRPPHFLRASLPATRRSVGTKEHAQDASGIEEHGRSSTPEVAPKYDNHPPALRREENKDAITLNSTWPKRGNKHFSPIFARHVVPLLEATPDDSSNSALPDTVTEILNAIPRRMPERKQHAFPKRRRLFSGKFRFARRRPSDGNYMSNGARVQQPKKLPRAEQSTELLEEELRLIAHGMPHPASVERILTMLIMDRHVILSSRHYEALILANCHPELGSVAKLRSILQVVTKEKLAIDASLSFAALKVRCCFFLGCR